VARALARQSRNQIGVNSRKGAKHVLSDVEGAAKKLNFWTWRSWRLGASKSRFLDSHGLPEKFAQAAKTSNYSHTKSTKFMVKNIRTLRGLRGLRGENIFHQRD
jgi:hypothetical protein